MRTCSVAGCNREYKAHGLCNPHYRRAKRSGALNESTRRTGCMFVDCDRPHKAHGLCERHYRWQIKPLTTPPKPVRHGCSINGCDRVHKAHGLCRNHYERQQQSGVTTPRDEQIATLAARAEEVSFFRSWNWPERKIARRLGYKSIEGYTRFLTKQGVPVRPIEPEYNGLAGNYADEQMAS